MNTVRLSEALHPKKRVRLSTRYVQWDDLILTYLYQRVGPLVRPSVGHIRVQLLRFPSRILPENHPEYAIVLCGTVKKVPGN